MIYLDNNATTATDCAVIEAMTSCLALGPMNPSSQHALGRDARNRFDEAISQIGRWLHADTDSPGGDQLIVTSGGSESNNWALHCLGDPSLPLVVSAIEHPSVLTVASFMQSLGREVRVIPVTAEGVIDVAAARSLIETRPYPGLVSVMTANNETGVLQPVELIAAICESVGVPLHMDATQSVGKLPFDFTNSKAAAVTFAAHKFHGPVGVGGLLVRSGARLTPWLRGGEQQLGKRAGTEPVALVVGMAKALELASNQMDAHASHQLRLRETLESDLSATIDGITFFGQESPRLPGTSCFSLPGVDRQAMLMALDLAGVACSSGSACASGSSRPSHVLAAMGVVGEPLDSALRIGLSRFSTADELKQAAEAICRQYMRLRRMATVEKSG
ncbi:MAG: cysteine desulfurase family protein [Planctomycetaceae bacterium]